MNHYDAILNHINAVNPCSYVGVINWAKSQGYGGSKMVLAIQNLINDQVIVIHRADGELTIDLI